MQPHDYPRRILVCASGLSPQIVTETLYALAVETHGRAPFVPTEIRLISTSEGAEQARLALLAPDRDQFGKLCREYGLSPIYFDESCIEVITDAEGTPLKDIRTPEHNELAADAITGLVARLTSDPDAAVHVSIAGGRKTMGFFIGYALSLHGREQDRLSHVLVSEGFEGHRDFFFKPRSPVTLADSRGREMSTATARIHLADIPFVSLRHSLHLPLLDGKATYADTVRSWKRSTADGELIILRRANAIRWQDVQLALAPVEMAVYAWLAHRRKQGPDKEWVSRTLLDRGLPGEGRALQLDLVSTTERLFSEFSQHAEKIGHQFGPEGAATADWIGPHISRINKKIAKAMDALAAKRLGIESDGPRNHVRYRLAADPAMIRID